MIRLLSSVLVVCAASAAFAADLGQQGRLYPIGEPDMRAVIQAQLAKVDVDALGETMKERAMSHTDRLPEFDLPSTDTASIRYFEPTYTVQREVPTPVQRNDKSWDWSSVGKPGQTINVMDHSRPATAFLVIDGLSEEQMAFAASVVAAEPYRVVPVLTRGNPQSLNEQYDVTLFYLTDWMHDYFGLTHTPSLVFPGGDGHRRALGVATFAAPYRTDEVLALWPN